DKKEHTVNVYFDASAEIAGNTGKDIVTATTTNQIQLATAPLRLAALKVGTKQQPVLAKKGDDLRIDWGFLYVATYDSTCYFNFARCNLATTNSDIREKFGSAHTFDTVTPTEAAGDTILATVDFTPFKVDKKPVSRWLMLAYDDEYSI